MALEFVYKVLAGLFLGSQEKVSLLYEVQHAESAFNGDLQFLEPAYDIGSEDVAHFMVFVHLLHLRYKPFNIDIVGKIDLR